MSENENRIAPVTDLLRRTIVESNEPLQVIERSTGVNRASIMRFLRGERSLRLDKVDALAVYFGLKLVKERKKAMSAEEDKASTLAKRSVEIRNVICEAIGDELVGIGWFNDVGLRAAPELAAFKGRLNEMRLTVVAAILGEEFPDGEVGCGVVVEAGNRFVSELKSELRKSRQAVRSQLELRKQS